MSDIIIPLLCRFIRIREYKFNSATADAFDALQSSPSRFMDCKRFATRHLIFSNGVRESEKKDRKEWKRLVGQGRQTLTMTAAVALCRKKRTNVVSRKKKNGSQDPVGGALHFDYCTFFFYFILYDANVFPS